MLTEVLFESPAVLGVGVAPSVWLALALVVELAKLKFRGVFYVDNRYDWLRVTLAFATPTILAPVLERTDSVVNAAGFEEGLLETVGGTWSSPAVMTTGT